MRGVGKYDKSGANNPKWRGGIASVKVADDILCLPRFAIAGIRKRFEKKFEIDPFEDCWVWTGRVFKSNGRALFSLCGNLLAARVAYVLYKGSTDGLCVLHTCDNVLCVRPDHLMLGTNADNSADMVAKGRQTLGSKNGSAILNEEQVRNIKSRIVGRGTDGFRELANEFGVSHHTIRKIASNKSWRHVQ